MWGDKGNDTLQGDAGNDFLKGGEGNDYLNGGSGDDFINANSLVDDEVDTVVFGAGGGADTVSTST